MRLEWLAVTQSEAFATPIAFLTQRIFPIVQMEVHPMKRDLDLARQLLLDIENRGTDCSVSVLRSGSNYPSNPQSEEQIRFHLRLLIDAKLLKEIDRTSAGVPCVRLTHEGHELLELVRSESRWREAKYACQERLGGLSLSVIQGILFRWAVAAPARLPRYQRAPVVRRRRLEAERSETEFAREQVAYRVEPFPAGDRLIDRDYWEEDRAGYDHHLQQDHVRYVNVRPERDGYRPSSTYSRNGVDGSRYSVDGSLNGVDGTRYGIDLDGDGRVDVEFESTLPGYLI